MAKGGDGRTDGRTDGRLEIPPCVLQDIGPLGPLPKKDLKRTFFHFLTHALRTGGQTNGRTDKASYRVVCPQLKKKDRKM